MPGLTPFLRTSTSLTISVNGWLDVCQEGRCQRGRRRLNVAGRNFVSVAPHPALARFDGADQRVFALMEVFGRVFVLRRIATSDFPADQAQAQVYPGVAYLYAFLTFVLAGIFEFDLVQVRASVGRAVHADSVRARRVHSTQNTVRRTEHSTSAHSTQRKRTSFSPGFAGPSRRG